MTQGATMTITRHDTRQKTITRQSITRQDKTRVQIQDIKARDMDNTYKR